MTPLFCGDIERRREFKRLCRVGNGLGKVVYRAFWEAKGLILNIALTVHMYLRFVMIITFYYGVIFYMTETRKFMEFNCLNWVGNYLGKVVYGTL